MPANSIDDRRTCDELSHATVQPLPPGVGAGGLVSLRGCRCRLESVVTHADCRELHATRMADGTRCVLLWPFDRPGAVEELPRLRSMRLRHWFRVVRRRISLSIDPLTPRAAGSAVDVVPFQLAPAVAIAAGACRILLADEVGLGKTIQAGWVVADLITREPHARALLAVPAGLRHQWAGELSTRFAIEAALVDARWLRGAIADLPADVSPWSPPGVYIASLDFLKRPDVAASIGHHVWDLLVIDEAHTATAPTDRHGALARFAAVARRVIAITATPYAGDPAGYASLVSIGAADTADPPLMFRRSRQVAGDPRRRRHQFSRIRISRAESRLQRLLERYSDEVWNEPVLDRDGARLAMTVLRKRALSSAAAAARSLRRRLALLEGRVQAPRQLPLFEDEDDVDDDLAPAALASPGLADMDREHTWLTLLIAAAEEAQSGESKLRYLQRFVRRLRGEPAVIFTEYRDTLLQLAAGLPPTLQLHGGLAAAERAAVQDRFNREGGLLLATDAAAEGLNLHHRCRLVVNYELPWNPARLEQRIGRVDRIGQRRTVHALTLTARDTAEDLVLRSLVRRLSRIVAALGPDDRLGAFLNDAHTAGIVIGGNPIGDVADAAVGALPEVAGDDGGLDRAARAARQITLRRSVSDLGPSQLAGSDIPVSHMQARGGCLAPGYVVVATCTARTADGFLAASQEVVLHLPGPVDRPHGAHAARSAARQLLRALDVRGTVPAVERWFADTQGCHAAAVQRRLERERDLGNRERGHGRPLQPGLFDRRALSAAERAAAAEGLRDDVHRRHREALERSRVLHFSAAPSAVLIVWR